RLCLYNVDGAVEAIDIALTLPTRSVAHVARLIELKLEALAASRDAGFGFEAIGLAVTCAEPMPARQTELASFHPSPACGGGSGWGGWGDGERTERCAGLIDALRQRLGPASVRRFASVASHLPERAEVLSPIDGAAGAPASDQQTEQPRPLIILPHA